MGATKKQLKRQQISHKREAKARKKRKEFERLKNIDYFKPFPIEVQKKPKVSLWRKIQFGIVLIAITIYQVFLKVKKIIKKDKENEI